VLPFLRDAITPLRLYRHSRGWPILRNRRWPISSRLVSAAP
jgi:hypothetical protein